jgi:hypothetical protein
MSLARSANFEMVWFVLVTLAAMLTAFALHVPAY